MPRFRKTREKTVHNLTKESFRVDKRYNIQSNYEHIVRFAKERRRQLDGNIETRHHKMQLTFKTASGRYYSTKMSNSGELDVVFGYGMNVKSFGKIEQFFLLLRGENSRPPRRPPRRNNNNNRQLGIEFGIVG